MKLCKWFLAVAVFLPQASFAIPIIPRFSGNYDYRDVVPGKKIRVATVYSSNSNGYQCLQKLIKLGYNCQQVPTQKDDSLQNSNGLQNPKGLFKCIKQEPVERIPKEVLTKIEGRYQGKIQFGQIRGQPSPENVERNFESWWVPQPVMVSGQLYNGFKWVHRLDTEKIRLEDEHGSQNFMVHPDAPVPTQLSTTLIQEMRVPPSQDEIQGAVSVTDKYLVQVVFKRENN